MYLRLTYLNISPEKAEEARKIYNNEVLPVVRQQKGNLDCKLLQPVDLGDDHISMTVWDNKEDADAYHSQGMYQKLVDKVKDMMTKEPVLKIYTSEMILEPA